MEFLGIGPLELVFIVLIALVLLGPVDMLKAAQAVGRLLRTLFTSEGWREIQHSMSTLRDLPTSMMREAGLEEELRTISDAAQVQIPAVDIDRRRLLANEQDTEDISADKAAEPPVFIQTPAHPPDHILEDDDSDLPDNGEETPPPDINGNTENHAP
jgi:Sec-independent protein translocase protein TatA